MVPTSGSVPRSLAQRSEFVATVIEHSVSRELAVAEEFMGKELLCRQTAQDQVSKGRRQLAFSEKVSMITGCVDQVTTTMV
jgi:hypothetical protein